MSIAQDRHTVPGDYGSDARTTRAGHRALAAAVGPHDGAAAQPLQPAALQWDQRLAVDGDGLRVPVLGDVQPGQNGRGQRPQGRARRPRRLLEGLHQRRPETGDEEKRFVLRYFTVFNAAQLEGVAVPAIAGTPAASPPSSGVPSWWAACRTGPRSSKATSGRFTRLPRIRCICRARHAFTARKRITPRLYHELVHAAGHPSRLNRKTLTDLCLFGSPTYAKEELVAEMGAAYLCGVCGIANATLDNSAAYLPSWMQVLRDDPTMLVQAAAQAQKAADYLQNLPPDVGA